MYFIILLIVIIILFFKNIETFTNSEYVIIGDNIINMENNNIFVLNANDINWKKNTVDIKLNDNITIDLIYNDNNFTINSSGSINKYYNSNELKQIIIKKKYLPKIYNTNYYPMSDYYYPMSDYYYPMSYPRIPYKHHHFRRYH
jgi:hypothetical protein